MGDGQRAPLNLTAPYAELSDPTYCCDVQGWILGALNWPPDAGGGGCMAAVFEGKCTERNLFEILIIQTDIRLYLPFSDWFGTKRTSFWFQINRKMVNTVWFRFDLVEFEKISLCVVPFTDATNTIVATVFLLISTKRNSTLFAIKKRTVPNVFAMQSGTFLWEDMPIKTNKSRNQNQQNQSVDVGTNWLRVANWRDGNSVSNRVYSWSRLYWMYFMMQILDIFF